VNIFKQLTRPNTFKGFNTIVVKRNTTIKLTDIFLLIEGNLSDKNEIDRFASTLKEQWKT
jgi:hypothetical protein